jgi:hypothetical protein
VYLKTKPVESEFFMFIGFKKITPLHNGAFLQLSHALSTEIIIVLSSNSEFIRRIGNGDLNGLKRPCKFTRWIDKNLIGG